MAGLYLHIPFCKQACYYCDFHFSTDTRTRHSLFDAMARELLLQKDYLNESIQTIYFGGGTPSLMTRTEMELLFNAIRKNFYVDSTAEITFEANPDDLSLEKLQVLREVGINRLSIGIQSFDDEILKFLNRAHNATASRRCLEEVRTAGFNNISIDLIYAIPGLSEERWRQTLVEVIQFSPEHISSYALTIEEKTVFGNWNKHGKLKPMEEELAARQFEILMEVLEQAGYEQYEISNFCKPGFHSKHNSSYWKQSHYLGIGPSAHSYQGDSRQFNVRNNALYSLALQAGTVPFEKEILTRENKINEYILTTLRTVWGCDLKVLRNQLNDDLSQRRGDYLSQLQKQDLISIDNDILLLTQTGKLLADKIAEDLMVDE